MSDLLFSETLSDSETDRRIHNETVRWGKVEMALEYYKAVFEGRPPKYVPCRVLLPKTVRGDMPMTDTVAWDGAHKCDSNRNGAIGVMATNGKMLGLRPGEWEAIEWRKNT